MDIAELLSVMVGYDGLDPRMSLESPLRADVRDYASELSKFASRELNVDEKLGAGIKISRLTESSVSGMSKQVRSTLHTAASRQFTASGAAVREISVPSPNYTDVHILLFSRSCSRIFLRLSFKHPKPTYRFQLTDQ